MCALMGVLVLNEVEVGCIAILWHQKAFVLLTNNDHV